MSDATRTPAIPRACSARSSWPESATLTGLALAHGYGTAFRWIAGIFAGGAVTAGVLLRPRPLSQKRTLSQAHDGVPTAQAKAGSARPA